ncbi:unnamed protein product [Orchesella dallaii]|uniref:Protein kinase domain-containing protein n=1 Tax=Orchesella dallaii TaxID=48710 RepID=A0ABP1RAY8_9HEXA
MANHSRFLNLLTFTIFSATLTCASIVEAQQAARDAQVCGVINTSSGDRLELKEGVSLSHEDFEKVSLMKLKGAEFFPDTKRNCAIKICGFTSYADRPPQISNTSLIGSWSDYADCKIFTAFDTKAPSAIYNDKFNASSVSCGCNKGIANCLFNCFERPIYWNENDCAYLYQETFCRNCYFNSISILKNGGFTTDNTHHIRSVIVRDNCTLTQDITGLNKIWRFQNVSTVFQHNSTRTANNIMSGFLDHPEIFHCSCDGSPPVPLPNNQNHTELFIIYVLAGVAAAMSIASIALAILLRKSKSKSDNGCENGCENDGENGGENGGEKGLENGRENWRENGLQDIDYSQIEKAPLDPKFEIPKSLFQSDSKRLGEGQFGTVVRGKLYIAIKSVKASTEHNSFAALQQEIKIMSLLSAHENVVRFFGFCNEKISIGQLDLIMELCINGSLLVHLREMICPQLKKGLNRVMQLRKRQNALKTVDGYTDEEPLVAANNIEQEHEALELSVFQKFLQWCVEIANGMNYITSKKVVHVDLAARNILLNHTFVAKICDFGLSRKLYLKLYSRSDQENLKLPTRWIAPEILEGKVFSPKSDVWSFGVTAWEIFSLGQTPYGTPGVNLQDLRDEVRLKKVGLATDDVYEKISQCWNWVPDKRPGFEELRDFFRAQKLKTAVPVPVPQQIAVQEEAPPAVPQVNYANMPGDTDDSDSDSAPT